MTTGIPGRRRRHRNNGPTAVYRFFDADDVLLYVGVTGWLTNRWLCHDREKIWWREAVRATIEHFRTRDLAEAAELAAIRQEFPKYNIRSRPQRPKPAPLAAPPIGASADVPRPEWVSVTQAAALAGVARGTVLRSLTNERMRSEWWGERGIGWRLRPLSRRLTYQVSKERALEVVNFRWTKPAAE